ncbi:PIN domain-containing protein [Chitinophaga sp. 22321]|uniref:DUF4935 domain-containing protein n=1 Tax=Chitinophaga hostae TaxID=2831022 RepID=A0ABS5J856_9BACT|nr:PIN domain-containing protein [Chitinophaga hostae]MBS0031379.1 DUF4935 domain-containing protein [Chitinophaga hostae]
MDKELIFLHHSIYPNASDIFDVDIKPLEEIIDDCIFVVDTNVLLLPYTTTSSGFEEIKKAFSKLIKKDQLIIPAQVAREFAKNRPEKIKNLYQQLNITKSKIQKPATGQYPLLESLDDYKEAVLFEKEIQKIQAKYAKKIDQILDQIKQWRWNDPVSSVYKELFKPQVIKELGLKQDEIIKELERRNKYNIPPGFNDKSKDDFGVGDLIIWLTILEVAKETKKDVVFISGDEKNDWLYRSENQSLYPRFELITEFKNSTGQKTFHVIKLSQLLNILGAKEEVVKEVEIKEINVQSHGYDFQSFGKLAENLVYNWLQESEPAKEILIIERGLTDFIIKDSEKTEGIDVMVIRDVRSLTIRLQERYLRAYHEIHEGGLNCFRIIIIVQNKESVGDVLKYLNRHAERYRNEFIQMLVGFITESSELEIFE